VSVENLFASLLGLVEGILNFEDETESEREKEIKEEGKENKKKWRFKRGILG
jgi:hypothetical protein